MARVAVEDCVEKVPNRFELVMVASQRSSVEELLEGKSDPTVRGFDQEVKEESRRRSWTRC